MIPNPKLSSAPRLPGLRSVFPAFPPLLAAEAPNTSFWTAGTCWYPRTAGRTPGTLSGQKGGVPSKAECVRAGVILGYILAVWETLCRTLQFTAAVRLRLHFAAPPRCELLIHPALNPTASVVETRLLFPEPFAEPRVATSCENVQLESQLHLARRFIQLKLPIWSVYLPSVKKA